MTIMLLEQPIFDEARCWAATIDIDDEFFEDENLFADVIYTENWRDKDRAREYGEDALIYNALILEGTPEERNRQHLRDLVEAAAARERILMRCTKEQLLEKARVAGVDNIVSMKNTKRDIVDVLLSITKL